MSTTEAIRFKSLVNQLSTTEKHTFVLQLPNEPDDLIANGLFAHFLNNQNKQKILMKRYQQSLATEMNPKKAHNNIN